ncbi:hypothetical protein N7471_013133 [Penicillium samsonianum]|uniref:uncharacterized protein n=1 Tax=Penicillium samsonianum TaxID=1882272 RepID=UPI0025479EEC|nr:uncharacterized protein N7471_013133 [Penicillium samsonianum]KAJ6118513.1 hypothetical protein N7471_013133 [Penicillium samsonianum]
MSGSEPRSTEYTPKPWMNQGDILAKTCLTYRFEASYNTQPQTQFTGVEHSQYDVTQPSEAVRKCHLA